MNENARDAQRVGDLAGVLAAGAAEGAQRVLGHVVAALDRDLLDGVGHVLDRDPQEPLGHLHGVARIAGGIADLLRQGGEFLLHDVGVEGLVGSGTEDVGKMLRLQLAQHQVAVCDGERPAATVACRAGIGGGGVRSDAVAGAVEMQDRAAAGGDGVDLHHRRAHAHAGDQCVERTLELAVVVRDVGRSAAHVEADDAPEAGLGGGAHGTDDAGGGAGEDGVLALEQPRVGETAVGLHEHEARLTELRRHLAHVAAEDRRQVGIDDRGVAAAHQLHQRAHLVAGRDLGEADLARQRRHLALVLRGAVGVHEDDGGGADAGRVGSLEPGTGAAQVHRAELVAVGQQALVDLNDPLVQQLRQDDVALEQLRPVLVGDAQRIGEAPGDDKHRAVAGALQEGICGHGGAHFHRGDGLGGDGRRRAQAEHVADALERGVAIALGVLRQDFMGDEAAVGTAGDHVGEGAAAVDPELPAPILRRAEGRGLGHVRPIANSNYIDILMVIHQ